MADPIVELAQPIGAEVATYLQAFLDLDLPAHLLGGDVAKQISDVGEEFLQIVNPEITNSPTKVRMWRFIRDHGAASLGHGIPSAIQDGFSMNMITYTIGLALLRFPRRVSCCRRLPDLRVHRIDHHEGISLQANLFENRENS